ncbi:hypothetical protein ENBRE01_1830 [Enteropsectra breve]|nr:hypothetical protein ENBRE01_1830 [Enteropsectra breve]
MEEFIFENSSGICRTEIRDFVSACPQCQVSTPYTTLPQVRPIIENAKLDRFIADSIDMRKYADQNDGFKWILNIVDSYLKFAWSVALKEKSASAYLEAFKAIFLIEGTPKIYTVTTAQSLKMPL